MSLQQILKQVPADYYDKTGILQNLWHNTKFKSFKSITSGRDYGKILDIGCAGGTLTRKIAAVFPKSQITAIDAYPDAINYAKKRYKNIKFLTADAHKLPFKQDAFDLVVCYETIEHVENPLTVLKEINRVLKKNGRAVVAMDSGNFFFRIIWWFWEKTHGRVWQGAHLHPFHHTELEHTILKSGLKIECKNFSHFSLEVSFLLYK